ncbi:MAG: hypothetical protein HW386_1696 [Gammaproteobacteria bacterium]|nr:hypothetical protein [Gammaproteobacteria bacterium]
MSQRRKLRQRLRQLADIRDIMDAMKNLAQVEIFKLKPRLENQQQMVLDLERMAEDFLSYHPYSFPDNDGEVDIWVLFGSERGFCGDFNEALLEHLDHCLPYSTSNQTFFMPIGGKLIRRFTDKPDKTRAIDGLDVAEEVPLMLNHIVNGIGQLQSQFNAVNVHAVFHHADTGQLTCKQLLPPFEHLRKQPSRQGTTPLLHIPPADFFSILVDEYLYYALHEIAYLSLLSENNKRIQHMTGALQRLDEKTGELTRQYHLHRQEEITEELEVILLNTTIV